MDLETSYEQKEVLREKILGLKKQEDSFREQFRQKRAELEALVQPITNFNEKVREFWADNFADKESINLYDNETCKLITIKKPEKEVASVETYLPFSVDYEIKDILF